MMKMPNWCYNSATLETQDTAAADDFESYLNALQTRSDDNPIGVLSYFFPRPLEEEDNWYSWNVHNWGTKWDVTDFEWQRDGNAFHLNFDTAWGPPVGVYEHITDNEVWTVDATYEESGMCFVGRYSDGVDETYEYDFDDENWRDHIPEEIVEEFGLDYSYEDYQEMIDE